MKKKSVARQIFGVIGTHLALCFFYYLIFLAFLSMAQDHMIIRYIVSVVMAGIYAYIMFTKAYAYAHDDNKSYSQLKAYPLKGAVISSGLLVLIVALWIWHWFAWQGKMDGMSVASSALTGLLTAPFWCFVGMAGAEVRTTGQVLSVLVPFVSCVAGYYAGYKKWDYIKYINRFIYEKKK